MNRREFFVNSTLLGFASNQLTANNIEDNSPIMQMNERADDEVAIFLNSKEYEFKVENNPTFLDSSLRQNLKYFADLKRISEIKGISRHEDFANELFVEFYSVNDYRFPYRDDIILTPKDISNIANIHNVFNEDSSFDWNFWLGAGLVVAGLAPAGPIGYWVFGIGATHLVGTEAYEYFYTNETRERINTAKLIHIESLHATNYSNFASALLNYYKNESAPNTLNKKVPADKLDAFLTSINQQLEKESLKDWEKDELYLAKAYVETIKSGEKPDPSKLNDLRKKQVEKLNKVLKTSLDNIKSVEDKPFVLTKNDLDFLGFFAGLFRYSKNPKTRAIGSFLVKVVKIIGMTGFSNPGAIGMGLFNLFLSSSIGSNDSQFKQFVIDTLNLISNKLDLVLRGMNTLAINQYAILKYLNSIFKSLSELQNFTQDQFTEVFKEFSNQNESITINFKENSIIERLHNNLRTETNFFDLKFLSIDGEDVEVNPNYETLDSNFDSLISEYSIEFKKSIYSSSRNLGDNESINGSELKKRLFFQNRNNKTINIVPLSQALPLMFTEEAQPGQASTVINFNPESLVHSIQKPLKYDIYSKIGLLEECIRFPISVRDKQIQNPLAIKLASENLAKFYLKISEVLENNTIGKLIDFKNELKKDNEKIVDSVSKDNIATKFDKLELCNKSLLLKIRDFYNNQLKVNNSDKYSFKSPIYLIDNNPAQRRFSYPELMSARTKIMDANSVNKLSLVLENLSYETSKSSKMYFTNLNDLFTELQKLNLIRTNYVGLGSTHPVFNSLVRNTDFSIEYIALPRFLFNKKLIRIQEYQAGSKWGGLESAKFRKNWKERLKGWNLYTFSIELYLYHPLLIKKDSQAIKLNINKTMVISDVYIDESGVTDSNAKYSRRYFLKPCNDEDAYFHFGSGFCPNSFLLNFNNASIQEYSWKNELDSQLKECEVGSLKNFIMRSPELIKYKDKIQDLDFVTFLNSLIIDQREIVHSATSFSEIAKLIQLNRTNGVSEIRNLIDGYGASIDYLFRWNHKIGINRFSEEEVDTNNNISQKPSDSGDIQRLDYLTTESFVDELFTFFNTLRFNYSKLKTHSFEDSVIKLDEENEVRLHPNGYIIDSFILIYLKKLDVSLSKLEKECYTLNEGDWVPELRYSYILLDSILNYNGHTKSSSWYWLGGIGLVPATVWLLYKYRTRIAN